MWTEYPSDSRQGRRSSQHQSCRSVRRVAPRGCDAANSSASGIDPDISVANADIQAHRVAAVRHLSLSTVDRMISQYTSGRGLGFSGEPGVDVLELNLALNRTGGGR